MDKRNALIIFFFFLFFLSYSLGNEGGVEQSNSDIEEVHENKVPSYLETAKSFFSLPTNLQPPSPASTSSWMKVKTMINHAHSYIFPPNLDFRGSNEAQEEAGGGPGEKVKEAVVKSFGKTKSAVEDSAKSATNFARETMKNKKTAQTAKETTTLSDDL